MVALGWGLQWLSKCSARVVLSVQRGENYTHFWDPSTHLKQRLWADSLWTEMCLFYFWSGLNNSSFLILFHPYLLQRGGKKRQKTLMRPFGSSGGEIWILRTFFFLKKRTLINRVGSFKQLSSVQGRQICLGLQWPRSKIGIKVRTLFSSRAHPSDCFLFIWNRNHSNWTYVHLGTQKEPPRKYFIPLLNNCSQSILFPITLAFNCP